MKSDYRITKLFLDYDGTLVPLVSSPELAKADDELKELLNSIKELFPMYIITGRDMNDILGLIGYGYNIIAMHGAEFLDEKGKRENIENFNYYIEISSALSKKYSFLEREFPGVRVIDKHGGVQFHYFNIRKDLIKKFQTFMEGINEKDFELYSGKYVYELRIKGINKGIAILNKIEEGDHIIFAGDDNTDEEAFSLLKNHMTIKVGEGNTAAKYRVDSYSEVRDILRYLIHSYRRI